MKTVRCLICVLLGGGLMPLASAAGPLKVFLLVGQSNMQGHAHVRTIEHLAMVDECQETLSRIR